MRKIFPNWLVTLIVILFFVPINSISQDWQQYYQQMAQDFQAGKNKSAIENGEKAIELLSKTDTVSGDYAALLNNLSYVYLIEKNYIKAIWGYQKVIHIVGQILGKKHPIYLKSSCSLGEAYMYNKEYDKAESIFVEALNTRKKTLDKKAPFYVDSYIFLKRLYEHKQDYKKALLYQDTVIAITNEVDGEFHANHLIELNNKAAIYEKNAEFDKAIGLRQLVVNQQLAKDELAEESFNYLSLLANTFRKKGDLQQAIKTYQLISKNRKRKGGEDLKYANSLSTLGVAYFEQGEFSKSENNYIDALEILRKSGEENTADYAWVLNNLAVLYYQQGDLFLSEQYYLKAQEIRKKTIGENHPDYVFTLNGLAVLYQESGNYKKAEPLYLKGLEIIESQGVYKNTYYALLTNLGGLYEITGRITDAADTYLKAYNFGVSFYGEKHGDLGILMKKIAELYKTYGHFDIAESSYKKSGEIILASFGKNHPEYSYFLNSRGEMYIRTKEYKKAEKDLLEAAELTRKIFGELHFQYAAIQNNLAALYFETDQIKKCEKNLVHANESLINRINESVRYMTGSESDAFLNSTDYLFDTYYSFYFNQQKRNPALTSFAYDNILARKGLMLQAEKNLRKAVFHTGDSALIKDYLEFISLKEKQGRLYTSNKQLNEDSVKMFKDRAEKLEKRVTTHPKIINSSAQINIAGWKDIRKSLQKDEVAIEFLVFNYRNLFYTDSVFYCALILRPDYKYPKMVFLFEENQLDSLLEKKNYYSDEGFIGHLYHKKSRAEEGYKPENDKISSHLYDLTWKPLEKYLGGAKTIYYSPGGLLHTISYAALSINDSTYLSDKYKLNTLISTRNIIDHERYVTNTEYKVSLYGGIDYDVRPEEIAKLTRSYKKDIELKRDKSKVKLLTQTANRGTTWNYLHGTLEETEAIEALFRSQKVEIESYKGDKAIEETFKQYTGDIISPNIIHIATHGFFIEDPDTIPTTGSVDGSFNAFEVSKNPLFRSGLLFAGANRSWNNLQMPENAEDGILTAYEVSNTNLINTELVVLSACETGLGEIKGGEGVYGLQRSFKIAGAEYVIMSLWQIPDYQTVELMKYFYTYKNLNFTIPEAFSLAQNEMKRKYLPYFWAAFVLLK